MLFKKFVSRNKLLKRVLAISAGLVTLGLAQWAVADPTAIALSTIASHVDSTVGHTATILSDISLIAGIGFVLASFFKFHQHKLNPTQVPISQGVTLLLIGAALLLFPWMLPTATKNILGESATSQIGSSDIQSVVGGGSGMQNLH